VSPFLRERATVSVRERLRLVLYQEVAGLWVCRGLEHDLTTEGPNMAEAVCAMLRMVQAHSAFDARHDRPPLSAFRPAPQAYWNAFHGGSPVPLSQFAALQPPHWEVSVAIAPHRPAQRRLPWPVQASA
jgi:hypothetical protein